MPHVLWATTTTSRCEMCSSHGLIPAIAQDAVSQRIRKRIEEAFGWIKTIARQDKTKFRGRDRVGWAFAFAAAAYDLVRLPKLMAASP